MVREKVLLYDSNFLPRPETLSFSQIVSAISRISWSSSVSETITHIVLPLTKYGDAKLMMDKYLKQTCEDLIFDTTKTICDPVSSFLLKIQAIQLKNVSTQQTFAQPEAVEALYQSFLVSLELTLKNVNKKIQSYLGDRTTQTVLIGIIRVKLRI